MNITAVFCHYKTGKMTAYTISQLLKYKGEHDLKIVVVDNNAGDGSADYFIPFNGEFSYVTYPKGKLQSHAIGIEYALEMGFIQSDYFITMESDSFPVKEGWLDYYEKLINEGYDAGGSVMKLSGGFYMHPCGALYSKNIYKECKEEINKIEYDYFPNMYSCEGFDCHVMIHKSVVNTVISNLSDYIEVAEGYKNLTKDQILKRRDDYFPTTCVFHNGMGNLTESVRSYGNRTFANDVAGVDLDNRKKIIRRIGAEPGQYFSYWLEARNKKVFYIPIEIEWMKERENQQQEFTLNEAGFKHIWGISSYTERPADGVQDIFKEKREMPDKLYETLPDHQKI